MAMSGNASVASDRYEPRSRRQRNPVTAPTSVATSAPSHSVIQGDQPSFCESIAEVYAPAPKNRAWPKFTCPA